MSVALAAVLERTATATALIAASHGTSDEAGRRCVAALVAAVADALPNTEVLGSFVDVQQPDVPSSIATIDPDRPIVVVPLLLSAGYHVHVDLAEAAADAGPGRVRVTGALGPDPRLARILATRLRAAGLRPSDRVVLAAAGSSDARAVADCHRTAAQLAAELGREMSIGFLSAADPRLPDAVAAERARHPGARVVVASYLLAPGYFADLTRAAGGDVTTEPLLAPGLAPDPLLVDLVADLFTRATPPATERSTR